MAGNALDGVHRAVVHLAPGTWKFTDLFLVDAVGNPRIYPAGELADAGFPISFTLP